ncbi:MAG TPA: hypothetical protein DCQ50_17620 [Chryseobacterium sp.]|nr:hypothetical protein [Chryseobacterium sp.]
MNERIIPLRYNRTDFEEIYFKDNQGSLFFSPTTKNKTIFTLVIGVILTVLHLGNLVSLDNIGVYYFLNFVFFGSILYLLAAFITIVRWKKVITKYLKSLDNSSFFQLELTEMFLIINIDHQEDYIQWKEFTKVESKNDYIFLQSGIQNYLFPKKAMSEEDYIFFKESLKKILSK